MRLTPSSCLVLLATLPTLLLADPKPTLATRQPGEDVNSVEVRTRPGLAPSADLLFNGWGVSPAGTHVSCGDMALKMVITPDKAAVLAVCAGYNQQGVNVVSLDSKRAAKRVLARLVVTLPPRTDANEPRRFVLRPLPF